MSDTNGILGHHIEQIRQRRVIWHVCSPKSASTFLSRCLEDTTTSFREIQYIGAVPGYNNRPQVLCAYTLAEAMLEAPEATRLFLTFHTHTLATEDLLVMISRQHLTVVQVRPLLDTIVSLFDHMNAKAISPFGISNHHFWHTLCDDQKMQHIIDIYVPWHVQFIQGWDYASTRVPVKWIWYDDVVSGPKQVVGDILSAQSVHCEPVISSSGKRTRFNIGRSGRGKAMLSEAHVSRVESIVLPMKEHWQPHRHCPEAEIIL